MKKLVALLVLGVLLTSCTTANASTFTVGSEVRQSVPRMTLPLKDFTSLEELTRVVNSMPDDFISNDYNAAIVVDESGVANLNAPCVSVAIAMRDYAATQGYFLSLNALSPADFAQWYKRPLTNEGHMVNMAVIGKNIYYIDPADKRIWLGALNGSLIGGQK